MCRNTEQCDLIMPLVIRLLYSTVLIKRFPMNYSREPFVVLSFHMCEHLSEPQGGHSELGSFLGQAAAVSNKNHWLINLGQDELCLEKIEAQGWSRGGDDQRVMSGFLKIRNKSRNENKVGRDVERKKEVSVEEEKEKKKRLK